MEAVIVSNVAGTAPNQDKQLVNPQSVLITKCKKDSRKFYIWVSNYSSSTVTKYSSDGSLLATVAITNPYGLAKKSGVIYVSANDNNVYMIDKSNTASVYLAVGAKPVSIVWIGDRLYVAAYTDGVVLVYEKGNTTSVLSIEDPELFSYGYNPYALYSHGNELYISYTNNVINTGNGYIQRYNIKKNKIRMLIARSGLNMPSGIVIIGNEIYVSNAGDGTIGIFDVNTGQYISNVSTEKAYTSETGDTIVYRGGSIINDGIMDIVRLPGNVRLCEKAESFNPSSTLVFVAANAGGAMGSLGYISLNNTSEECCSNS